MVLLAPSSTMSLRDLQPFFAAACALLVLAAPQCSAFGILVPSSVITRSSAGTTESTTATPLHMFGNLKGAFSNDKSLGKVDASPGLKGGPNVSECTINGKPVKAVAGQKVSQVAAAARVKITYSCKKGDCGTCEIMQNGRIVKACQAKINSGKCDIRTL